MRIMPLACIAVLCLTLVPAGARTLSGAVTIRERIALPGDATVLVETRDATGSVIATAEVPLAGSQPPVAFSLDADDTAATLRAAIALPGERGDEIAWVTDPVPLDTGAGDLDLGTLVAQRFRPMGFASLMQCGEVTLEVGFVGDIARLRIGATYIDLVPQVTASGAKFADPADAGTYVWSKGDEMTVSLAGQTLPPCRRALPDAAFVAQGNEPGWRMDVAGGQIAISQMGEKGVVTYDLPMPEVTAEARIYRLADDGTVMTVRDTLCRDDATGMPYPVAVEIDGATGRLTGCGGGATAMLTGIDWTVTAMGEMGQPAATLPDGATATIRFTPEGRVAGRSFCNRFMGGYTLTGEGLTFGPAATTQMACAEPVMAAEQAFLRALESVTRFDFDAAGQLLLIAGDTPVITARR